MRLKRLDPFRPFTTAADSRLGWQLFRSGFMLGLLFIAAVSFTNACMSKHDASAPATETTPEPVAVEPVDQGNGVFYFPVTGEAYIAALAKFYENGNGGRHCDMQGFTEKVVSAGPWVDAKAYTETTGFILHCHDLAVDAQELTKE